MDAVQLSTLEEDRKKSPSALRTIGEVADELNLPQHVLRFWESKFTQIKPHKRRGGHRYYRPADVEFIKEIKTLLYEKGFTIKGAQKYLGTQDKQKFEKNQGALFSRVEDSKSLKPGLSTMQRDRLKKVLLGLKEVRDLLKATS